MRTEIKGWVVNEQKIIAQCLNCSISLQIKSTEEVMGQRTASQPRGQSPHTVGSPTFSPYFLPTYVVCFRGLPCPAKGTKSVFPPRTGIYRYFITYVPGYTIQHDNLCKEDALGFLWAEDKSVKTKVTLKNRVEITPTDSKTACM